MIRVGSHARAAAFARGWRVGQARSANASGHPVVPLYDERGEYVGLVALTPRRMAPVGEWFAGDLQRLVALQRVYVAARVSERYRAIDAGAAS